MTILYHGSPNKFTQFDTKKIRTNGTSEGVGFYFTTNKDIAKNYANDGYLYTVNLDTQKSLSDNSKTINKNQLHEILIKLNKYTDYLENYGDISNGNFENVLNQAVENEYEYNNTDVEIIGSIYNTIGENPVILDILYKDFNYTHIKSTPDWGEQELYIALNNEIIKIIEIEKIG